MNTLLANLDQYAREFPLTGDPEQPVPVAPVTYAVVRAALEDFTPPSPKSILPKLLLGLSRGTAEAVVREQNERRLKNGTIGRWYAVAPDGSYFGVVGLMYVTPWEPTGPECLPPGVVRSGLALGVALKLAKELNRQLLQVADRPKFWHTVIVSKE